MIKAADARDMMLSGSINEITEKLVKINDKIVEKAKNCEKEARISFDFNYNKAGLFEVLKYRLINTYGYKCEMTTETKPAGSFITFHINWV